MLIKADVQRYLQRAVIYSHANIDPANNTGRIKDLLGANVHYPVNFDDVNAHGRAVTLTRKNQTRLPTLTPSIFLKLQKLGIFLLFIYIPSFYECIPNFYTLILGI